MVVYERRRSRWAELKNRWAEMPVPVRIWPSAPLLATDLLIHRSILTHGFLIPLVLFMIALRMKNNLLRDFALIFMIS